MDENDHPRGALLFMLVYPTAPRTTPGFRVW